MSQSFYCMHCGYKAPSVSTLVAGQCPHHPEGKGKHVLYEGGEKSQYTCKHCGYKLSTLSSLTSARCSRHPEGSGKGYHIPAL